MALLPHERRAFEAALAGDQDAFDAAYADPTDAELMAMDAPLPEFADERLAQNDINVSLAPAVPITESPQFTGIADARPPDTSAAAAAGLDPYQMSVLDAGVRGQDLPAPPVQAAPQAAPAGAPAQAPPQAMQPESDLIGEYLINSARGSPARTIPAQTVPTQTTIEGREPLPEGATEGEDAARAGYAAAVEEAAANQSIDRELAAMAAADRKVDAAADLAEFQIENAEVDQELARREAEFAQLVEDSAIRPFEYWRDRSTEERVVSAIGAFLMAFSNNGNKVVEIIEKDTQRIRENRDRKLSAEANNLDAFRERAMSPEAALKFEDALKLRMAAEDASILAEQAASTEVRERGKVLSQQLLAESEARRVDALRAEQQVIRQGFQYQPARTVGGGGGIPALVKQMKALGVPDDQIMHQIRYLEQNRKPDYDALQKSGVSVEAAHNIEKDIRQRQIILPSGEVAWASDDKFKEKAYNILYGADTVRKNIRRQIEIMRKPLSSITPADKADYEALVRSNTLEASKGVYDLGALAGPDALLVAPFSLEGRNQVLSMDSTGERLFKSIDSILSKREQDIKSQLYSDPSARPDTKLMPSEAELGIRRVER